MAVSLVSRSLLRLGLTTGHPGFAESIVRNAILSALDHSGPAKRDEQIQTLRDACQIANIDRSGLGPKQDEMRSGFSSRHPQGQLNQRGPTRVWRRGWDSDSLHILNPRNLLISGSGRN